MAKSTGEETGASRLEAQLERLLVDGCCEEGEMVVFPVPPDSSALTQLSRAPGVTIERIGPDVVLVRRSA